MTLSQGGTNSADPSFLTSDSTDANAQRRSGPHCAGVPVGGRPSAARRDSAARRACVRSATGHVSLLDDGVAKALAGTTSVAELVNMGG